MTLLGEIQSLVNDKKLLTKKDLSYYEDKINKYIQEVWNKFLETKQGYLLNRIKKTIYWFNELKKLQ